MAERRLAAGFRRDFLGKAECNPALRTRKCEISGLRLRRDGAVSLRNAVELPAMRLRARVNDRHWRVCAGKTQNGCPIHKIR